MAVRRLILIALLASLLPSIALPSLAWAQTPGQTTGQQDSPLITDLSAHLIAIQQAFTGTSLLLFGAIEEPGDIVVVVRGPPRSQTVRRKERIAGIWLNADSLTFEDVPGYYNVIASRPLFEVASPALLQRMRIGLDNVRFEPQGEVSPTERRVFRLALIRAKMHDKLFQEGAGTVSFLGPKLFRATVEFPSTVPTGIYRVEVYLFKGEKVIAAQATPLFVNKVGLEQDVFDFAHERALLYGIISVVLAMSIGWLAALVMQRR